MNRVAEVARAARLKRDAAVQLIYHRGRWARGRWVSIGALHRAGGPASGKRADTAAAGRFRGAGSSLRIGLRTKKGLKGAVNRNRLKRQLRSIVFGTSLKFRPGFDVIIVAHPIRLPAKTNVMEEEVKILCKQLGVAE